jgi:hypothetical protein
MARTRTPISLKQRFHREWAIVFCVFWLLTFGAAAVATMQPMVELKNAAWIELALAIPCYGVVFFALIVYIIAITIRWKRLCRQAAAADGLLCPSCRYSLRWLAAEDPTSARDLHCPECGYATTRRAMVEHWDLITPGPGDG